MRASDWLSLLLAGGAGISVAFIVRGIGLWRGESLFKNIFNGIKSGLLSALIWLGKPPLYRTFAQRKYNTSMTWAQVRWSIARLEHEMLPRDQYTHDVADCVHPDCNPEFLEKMTTLAWESISKVPILRKPPPPPPPKRSRGGPVTASEMRLPPHFACPYCKMISFNPNDIANQYCGNCHLFF